MRKAIGAAALGCGILFGAGAAELLPASGPLAAATLQRLLLVDGERIGKRIVAVGARGYIVLSDDDGASWRRAKSPAEPLLTGVDFLDERQGIAVGHDSVILTSADGGESWTLRFSAPAEGRPLLDVIFPKKDFAVAVGAYGAYYESTDAGATWSARKIIAEDRHFNAIVGLGEGNLLILGEAGTILTSGDWGKSWTPVASPYKGSLFGALVADDGAVVAFGMRGRIYRSTDKGKGWKQVDNPSTATLIGGTKLAGGALVIAGSAGMALVSRDNGQSFVPIDTGTTRALAKPVPGADATVVLLGEAGAREVKLPVARP